MNEHDDATRFTMFDRVLGRAAATSWPCRAARSSWRLARAAIERAERPLHVSPLDPLHYLAYKVLAVSSLGLGQDEQARDAARLSVQLNLQFAVCHPFLTAAWCGLGE